MLRARNCRFAAALTLIVGSTSMASAQVRTVFRETEFADWSTVSRLGAGTASGSAVAEDGLSGAGYRVRHRHERSASFGGHVTSHSLSSTKLDPGMLALDGPVRISLDLRFEVDAGWDPALPPELVWTPLLEQAGQSFSPLSSAEQKVTTIGSFESHSLQLDPGDWRGSRQVGPDLSPGAPAVRLGLVLQTIFVPSSSPTIEARIVIDNLTIEALGGDLMVSFAETYPPAPDSTTGLPRILAFDLESFGELLGEETYTELTVVLQLDRDPGGSMPTVMMNHPAGGDRQDAPFEFNGQTSTRTLAWSSSVSRPHEQTVSLFDPSPGLVIGEPGEVDVDVLSCIARIGGVRVRCDEEHRLGFCAHSHLQDLLFLLGGGRIERALDETPVLGPAADSEDPAALLRSFRDRRMAQTPAGRYYRSLYDELSPELTMALIPRPSLVLEIAGAQPPWLDAIAAAVDGRDDEVALSPQMVAEMMAILDRFESAGSDRLRRALRSERERLGLGDLTGKSMAEAIQLISERGGPPPCENGPRTLCLSDRFRVDVFWKDFADKTGEGRAVPLSDDSGAFWFFDSANIELVVKALDGTALNDRFWFFYGALSNVEYILTVTDAVTGAVRMYRNPSGEFASVGDTDAFTPDGSPTSSARGPGSGGLLSRLARAPSQLLQRGVQALFGKLVGGEPLSLPRSVPPSLTGGGPAAGTCVPTANALCLNDARFQVEVSWRDFAGRTGVGGAQLLTGDTGTFWFFDPANVELIVKVLDGRALNDRFWVFYGALSNVEYTLRVTDTENGQVRTYHNLAGELGSRGDTEAF